MATVPRRLSGSDPTAVAGIRPAAEPRQRVCRAREGYAVAGSSDRLVSRSAASLSGHDGLLRGGEVGDASPDGDLPRGWPSIPMAWARTRGNAENAHACALRTAPATQHREVRGRHLGLPHHQERHGQPAVTAGGDRCRRRPWAPTRRRRGPKLRPGPRGAAVPLWACPCRPVILSLAPVEGCTARSLEAASLRDLERRSRSRPLVVAELCAAYAHEAA